MKQIIIRKNIDSLCVFMFKRIDSENLADLRENKKRLKPHMFTLHCGTVVSCMRLFGLLLFFFKCGGIKFERTIFVATILPTKNVETKIYCRCRYHFTLCSRPSTLHTFQFFFLTQIWNVMKWRAFTQRRWRWHCIQIQLSATTKESFLLRCCQQGWCSFFFIHHMTTFYMFYGWRSNLNFKSDPNKCDI